MDKRILDTYLFLDTARKTLAEFFNDLPTKEERFIFKKFIMSEATDFEVIHLLFEGKLPEKKNDYIMESFYLDSLRKIGSIFNFVPLCEFNLSSQPGVMKFVFENNLVLEQTDSETKLKLELDKAKRELTDERSKPGTTREKVDLAEKKVNYVQAKLNKAKAKENLVDATKSGTNIEKAQAQVDQAENQVDSSQSELQSARKSVTTMGGNIVSGGVQMAGTQYAAEKFGKVFQKGGTIVKGMVKGLWTGAKQGWNILRPLLIKALTNPYTQVAAGALLVVLLAYVARKAYLRAFKQAEMACRGLSGSEKSDCIRRYKLNAYRQQLNNLKAGLGMCKYSKNPDKCSTKVRKKIADIQNKMSKIG